MTWNEFFIRTAVLLLTACLLTFISMNWKEGTVQYRHNIAVHGKIYLINEYGDTCAVIGCPDKPKPKPDWQTRFLDDIRFLDLDSVGIIKEKP